MEWICKYFNCDKKEAVQVGQKMYDKGYIVHVVDSGKGFHDEFLFYEFTVRINCLCPLCRYNSLRF